MKGYAIILLDVKDHERYIDYARKASAIEARYGGVALVAADVEEVVEGSWPSQRVVVLEFPTLAAAHAWYEDPEYADLISQRHDATTSNIVFVEGFQPR